MNTRHELASVRYIVDDVDAAVDFYTTHLGFTVHSHPGPAFADVVRGPLRLLLSGPASSGARATPEDAAIALGATWNLLLRTASQPRPSHARRPRGEAPERCGPTPHRCHAR
jgi:catechol 2,3-dioxygenase-like lactoylglutathione lyase family enzyme